MSRFLVFGKDGMWTSLAWKLQLEGEDVRFYIHEKEHKEHLLGMVQQVQSMGEGLRWVGRSGYVLCEDEQDCTWIRRHGFKVYGGNTFSAQFEKSRRFEMELARKAGIRIPNYHEMKSIDEAIAFVKKNPDQYVIKQEGGDAPKSWNFVGKDHDGFDILLQLEWMKAQPQFGKMKNLGFLLQEFVQGVEFSVSGFWQGKRGWMKNEDGSLILCLCKEHKKALNGDRGITTGELGSAVMLVSESRLFDEVLNKWTPLLEKHAQDVFLNIDTNCMIAEEDGEQHPYLMETTLRSGYPFQSAFEYMLETPQGEFYPMLLDGKQQGIEYKYGFCVVTVIGCGMFPVEFLGADDAPSFREQPVRFPFEIDEWDPHVQPGWIRFDEKSRVFRVADNYEEVATVTYHDDDPTVANKQCVDMMESIDVRAPFFRDDISEKFHRQEEDLLREWKYIPEQMTNAEYEREYAAD